MLTLAERLTNGGFEDDGLIDALSEDAIFFMHHLYGLHGSLSGLYQSAQDHLEIQAEPGHGAVARSRADGQSLKQPGAAGASVFSAPDQAPKEWCKDLDVPIFVPQETEYLLWTGCSVTYEERAQKIARAMVHILNKAGVSYGILEESRCTGDPAKQMGNEFLFSELAQTNIEEFDALGVKKIITLCPHCYNSFSRHYPPLGGNYTLIPHVVFIEQLIDQKKITPGWSRTTIAYHDPCYLGRRNRIFDEPRQLIGRVGRLVEMPNHGADSFCCGGGGGNYWAEEVGERINQRRSKEALDTGADKIATGVSLLPVDDYRRNQEIHRGSKGVRYCRIGCGTTVIIKEKI